MHAYSRSQRSRSASASSTFLYLKAPDGNVFILVEQRNQQEPSTDPHSRTRSLRGRRNLLRKRQESAHISPIFCYLEPLFTSKPRRSVLDSPLSRYDPFCRADSWPAAVDFMIVNSLEGFYNHGVYAPRWDSHQAPVEAKPQVNRGGRHGDVSNRIPGLLGHHFFFRVDG